MLDVHFFMTGHIRTPLCFSFLSAGQVLDVHFPLVVYKKLLGQRPGFADLKAAFPELGRGLQQLLDFEGDVEPVFCRT